MTMTPKEIRAEIVEGAARALFVEAYMVHCDDGGDDGGTGNGAPCKGCGLFKGHEDGHPQPGGGQDWMDFAPATSEKARALAETVCSQIEALNDRAWVEEHAVSCHLGNAFLKITEGLGEEATPELFGHYLAMEALGHGVAWSDSYPDHDLKIPDVETYDLLEG